MTKKEIRELCLSTKNGMFLREDIFKKKFKDEYEDLMTYEFPDNFKFKQKLYHWFLNDKHLKFGICLICGNRCRFLDINRGYSMHCSVKCAANSPIIKENRANTNILRYDNICSLHGKEIEIKTKKTNNERLGVDYPMQAKSVQEKAKITSNKNYGVDYPSQSEVVKERVRQTNQKKRGVDYSFQAEDVKIKIKESCNKNLGVDNPSQSNIVKERKRLTTQLHLGTDNPYQSEIVKQVSRNTCKERHGDEYPSRLKFFQDKAKNTTKERHGDEVYTRTEQYAEQCRKKFNEVKNEFELYGIHIGYGISKTELDFYKYLIDRFSEEDIVYSYKSDLYPYRCDFYIKSLDVYIELNAHWTHGGHPFNENSSKDVDKLESWKAKDKKYYKIAIQTWTVRDVEKRNSAYVNKLKYIEIFDNKIENVIKEFERQLFQFI